MAVSFLARRRLLLVLLLAGGLFFLLPDGFTCRAEIGALHLYQKIGSPVMSRMVTCRFEPTCSHYAVQSLEAKGLVQGNWLILKRLLRCSPIGLLL